MQDSEMADYGFEEEVIKSAEFSDRVPDIPVSELSDNSSESEDE